MSSPLLPGLEWLSLCGLDIFDAELWDLEYFREGEGSSGRGACLVIGGWLAGGGSEPFSRSILSKTLILSVREHMYAREMGLWLYKYASCQS